MAIVTGRIPPRASECPPRATALVATVIALALGLAASLSGASARAADSEPSAWVPGRMFIKLRDSAGPLRKADSPLRELLGGALDTAQPFARAARGPLPAGLDRLYEIALPADTDVPALAAKLSRLADVEYAEPVARREIAGDLPPVPFAVPSDPAYTGGQQAYLANLQVELAWDTQKSENGVPRPVVCIVDGGTNVQHEDLQANLWVNPGEIAGNGIDDDANGFIDDLNGWNFRNGTADPRGDPATPSNANHGTHTAGLAAAVTNNAIGVAAASWNPLLMSVNASGTSDRSIAYGYLGVIYAAENGADVVSLSWGGSGGSQAEQDVVDYATALGTLVVAAAGNGNTSAPFYPAALRNVIAVANVKVDDVRYSGPSGSNYGGWLDVAAPGTSVYSTLDMGVTNAYGASTGTSMACPVAAGVAALIAARNPGWGPLQVGEQLRISCDNINALNPGFADLLGKGRVNARRAVTDVSPAVRALTWTLADTGGDGQLNQGEAVTMSLVVHNYLAPALGPSYALSTSSPWITITDGAEAGMSLVQGGEATLSNAFAFTVSPNAPPGAKLDLRLDITATGYMDFQFLPIVLEPLFETHDVNALEVSLTGTGGVGWVGFPSGWGDEGDGFRFDGGPNVLFEGALLLGVSAARLSDAARASGERTDFAPVLHVPPVRWTPGAVADQEIHAAFTDSINTATPLGVRVDLTSYASAAPGDEGFVVVAFDVQNRNTTALDSLWAGLYFDWDIDENHYSTNRTAYDATRRMGYAWDDTPGLPRVGVVALSGDTAGFSAIPNNGSGAPWSLLDGFSKTEKWDVLQGGTGLLAAGPTDISNALSAGPYALAAGKRALVCFALVAGADQAALETNADRARLFFADSVLTDAPGDDGVAGTAPRAPVVALGPPVPNPFNPSVQLALELRAPRSVRVTVHDARGRALATLAAGSYVAGRHTLTWDGRDAGGRSVASGVYFARMQSGDVVQSRRMVLAR